MNGYADILQQPKTYTKPEVAVLINTFNEICARTFDGEYKNTFKTREEYMNWIAENLRQTGFELTPRTGASWGILK